MPRIHRVGMSPVILDPRFGVIRTPTRHPISRQEGFEDLFDFFTLFYDIFWSVSGEQVIALGPPLPKALDHRRDVQITALPTGTPCQFHYRKSKKPPLPCRLEIAVPADTHALVIDVNEQSWTCGIQPNLSSLFDGRVALVTMSRDNHLQWIRDWALYHAAECDVDTVIFYDNGTRSYELGDVALALSEVDELKDVVLIQQEALFGPVGFPAGGGPSDSAFLKPAMFEHARHRLLSLVDLYINLDIDEFLLPRTNRKLRDYLDRDEPVALIDRRNVENYSTASISDERTPSHSHYWWRKKKPSGLLPKWIAQPRRCSPGAVFTYHHVLYEKMWRCPEDELAIAHFIGVTTGWKEPERLKQQSAARAASLIEDIELRDRLARVLRADEPPLSQWTPLQSASADLALRWARQLVQENELREAKAVIDHALETDPNLLGALTLLSRIHELTGDAKSAERVKARLEELTILNPDWYVRRAAYARRKNVDTAIKILAEALGSGVESEALLALLGELHEQAAATGAAVGVLGEVEVAKVPNSADHKRAEEATEAISHDMESTGRCEEFTESAETARGRVFKPRMSPNELSLFQWTAKGKKYAVEFGAGGSTLCLIDSDVDRIFSVESDPAWIRRLAQHAQLAPHFASGRLTIHHGDIGPTREWGHPLDQSRSEEWPNYWREPWTQIAGESVDLVMVDGRFRVACTLNAILLGNQDMTIIVHDFWNRPQYKVLLDYLTCACRVDTLGVFFPKSCIDHSSLKNDLEKYSGSSD